MTRTELQDQLNALLKAVQPAIPNDESGQTIIELFDSTLAALTEGQEYIFLAEDLLTRMITFYPHLTPVIPRELLWAVGGSCLGFMEDEEIERFSAQSDDQGIQH